MQPVAGQALDDRRSAPALIIAGPNLTIDRTLQLRELHPGRVLRARAVVATPGGKGLNVARAARSMGVPAKLVSLLPGHTGRAAEALIAEEGVILRAVTCPGELRSTAVMIEEGGRTTVVNEPGPELPMERWRAYEEAVARALHGAGALVCSGSLPPGAPVDGYARLARLARSRDALAIVDVAGSALAAALDAGADAVVPNLGEAEALLDGASEEQVDAGADARSRSLRAATALVRRGARVVVVTAAEAGAALAHAGGEPRWLDAPAVAVVNPIGAGDVFTAVLAAALARGEPHVVAAAEAVAAAAASVETPLAGEFEHGRMRELAATMPELRRSDSD
jgi:1-phosphofructokinase family hexose kinase